MDKNINYENHMILFCITCRSIMYITNYNQHINSKKHNLNLFKKKNYKQKNGKYLVKFD